MTILNGEITQKLKWSKEDFFTEVGVLAGPWRIDYIEIGDKGQDIPSVEYLQ